MAIEWYYSQGQQQHGPVSFEELQSLAQSGTLSEDNLVWNEGMEDWRFAGHINGLIPTNEAAIPEADKRPTNSVPSASTFSELKHSLMATARTAGQLTAKQAEKLKLKTTIPKLYWKLGKHGLSSPEFREEFPERYQEIDKIQNELTQTAIHQQAKDNTFMEKAKATAGNAIQTAQGSKLSVTQASLISRLGKDIYERHHDNSGPEELVAPIREALSRMAFLDKEIGELSGGVSSYIGKVPPGWKQNPFLIGLSLFFCFPIGLIWMWTQSNWQSRTKWIITGVVCFFAFAIGLSKKDENRSSSHSTSQNESFAASDSSKEPATSTAPTSPAKEQTKLPATKSKVKGEYSIGEEFRLGDYKYTITRVEKKWQIGQEVFGEFTGEKAGSGATFVIVTYTIENCTKESQTVLSDDFHLLDAQGRKFDTSSKISTALLMFAEDKDFILSQLQPGLPRQMQQGFELPNKSLESELTLVVPKKGFWSSGEAKIKLRAK